MKEAKFEVGFYGEGFSEGAIIGEGKRNRFFFFFLVNKSVKGMYAGLWVSFFGLFLNAMAMAKSL